jgi:hypothetical protein
MWLGRRARGTCPSTDHAHTPSARTLAGALACLCGRAGRYLIRRAAASIGRSTDSKGDVDVDLAREGPACKVSRLQAQLLLGPDGAFALTNVGRRAVIVNGALVRGRCRRRLLCSVPCKGWQEDWAAGAVRRLVQAAAAADWAGAALLGTAAVCSAPAHVHAHNTRHWPAPPSRLAVASFPPSRCQLERGQVAPLPHLSLLEVGGVQLLFMVNALAVQRAVARARHLVM